MLHAAVEARILDDIWQGPELTAEQHGTVQDAYDYFCQLKQATSGQPGYHLAVEERVYLKSWHPCLFECDGTADIIITTDTEIHVLDWKFGQGIPVYAEDNDQLYAYAAGAIADIVVDGTEIVFIHCIQPRLDSYDVVELTIKQLMQWINGRLIPGVSAAIGDDPQFNPGQKQCRWCPAKMKCRARYNMANQTAADVFATIEKVPDQVTRAELTTLYTKAKDLERYIKDIGAHIKHEIEQGTPWPGYKIVAGRSIRRWKDDPDTVIEALQDDIPIEHMFTSKLISPAQAEKLNRALKKDPEFLKLVEKPEGKPTLASENDKRPPLEFRTAADIFGGMVAAIDVIEGKTRL